MTRLRHKLCMVGAFSVGKTSLVRRYVDGIFSGHYQTTVGVRIDKRVVSFDGNEVTLVLWDLHGEDQFQRIRESYLRGSSGYLLVADGTRPATIEKAIELDARIKDVCGAVPSQLLVNKYDLAATWEEPPEALAKRLQGKFDLRLTSAKQDEGVEAAFMDLARAMVARQ